MALPSEAIQSLLMSKFKRYRATLFLGAETDTLDRYGMIIKSEAVEEFSDFEIKKVLKSFLGKTEQVPPYFSAIHKNGKRLYKRALEGEEVSIDPREIEIKELALLKNEQNTITFEVLASKGTYIRSLGKDIAYSLGTYGYLTDLRRLQIGSFSVENAVKADEVGEISEIIPMNEALSDIPLIIVETEKALKIQSGIPLGKIFNQQESMNLKEGFYRIIFEKRLLALIEKRKEVNYFKVFKEAIKL